MNIELRHLRYFVAVAEELHFGRAAAAEHLSATVKPADSDPGAAGRARLLARTNRSVSLTAAGKQFLTDSRQILSMVDDAAARAERLYLGKPVSCASGLPRPRRLSAPSRNAVVIPPPFPGCAYSDARNQHPRADCAAE
jgi:DNA-binding transcriptional LysR family regulator